MQMLGKVALATAWMVGLVAGAQASTVTAFDPVFVANGQWFNTDTRPGGTASVVPLSGGAAVAPPLGSGAAMLTTTTGASKAEVGINDNFGAAGDILRSLQLHYSYYKEPVGDAAPAPSIKLSFLNPAVVGTGANRGFITLVWEAYVQPFPSFVNPTTGTWTDVDIDFDSGVFWGTNGFGNTSSGGGSPYRTLTDWLSVLGTDFANAQLVNVAIGLGTNNVNQVSYFDDVRISHSFGPNGYNAVYDFEPTLGEVPEPATLGLVAASLLALAATRRRHH